jgi:hypothetical protein
MRKTAATILTLGLLWIGYIVWPLYDLSVLVRAIGTRDVDTVTRHVYFDAVRKSLTSQIVAAYTRRTGTHISPLAQSMADDGIAAPIFRRDASLDRAGCQSTVGNDRICRAVPCSASCSWVAQFFW